MQAIERLMEIPITRGGVFNAVAFWFELQLDETITYSTSPYTNQGKTWQQAVQFFEELKVTKGSLLPIIAKHDTYGVNFRVDDNKLDRTAVNTGVPLWDPVWHLQFQKLEKINGEMARTTIQNPIEYRFFAETAVAMVRNKQNAYKS